jgi:hypothetical protein
MIRYFYDAKFGKRRKEKGGERELTRTKHAKGNLVTVAVNLSLGSQTEMLSN